MTAHRSQHAQSQLGLAPKQVKNSRLLDEQDLTWLDRASIGGVTGFRRERYLGKRIANSKNVNDLLPAASADSMHVHRSRLHNVKAGRRIAFMKEIFPLLQGSH